MEIPLKVFSSAPKVEEKNTQSENNKDEKSTNQAVSNNIESQIKEKWTKKIFDSIISVSLAAIFFGVPVFFTGLTVQGISFEKQIYFYFWVLIALIAWVFKGVIGGEMKIRRTPIDIPIIIFWFVYLLATIFSIDKWHSFWGFFGDPTHGFINVSASVIIYYLILSHFNIRRLYIILGSFITSGMVVVIWEILVFKGVLKILDPNFISAHPWAGYLPVSLLGSFSGVSIFLGVLIMVLITAFLKVNASNLEKAKKISLLALFSLMILVSLYSLLALYFFVPWPAIFIGIGFFLIYILARIVGAGKGSLWLSMSVFVAVMIILLVGNVLAANYKIISVQLPAEINPQYQLSWQVAKEAIKHNFFLGTGPATYGYNFSLYYPQDFNLNNLYSLQFYQGSGALWESLATTGAVGTFAFILLVVSFLSVTIYLLSKDKGKDKIYSLGLVSAMIIILIASFLTRIDGSMVIIGVILAALSMSVILLEGDAKEESLNFSLKASPKYALALAFVFLVISAGVVFLFVFLGRVYIADVIIGMATRQTILTEDNSVARTVRAINLYNKEGRYYTLGGQQYMVLANNEFLKGDSADVVLIGRYLDNSITLASRGKDIMPKDVTTTLALAQAYENKSTYLSQFFDQAAAAYNDALALEPNSPDIYLKLGQLKAKQAGVEKDPAKVKGLISEAADMFQKSIDKKKNFAQGYYYLSLMQDQMGDLDKAIESAKNAVSVNMADKNIVFNLATLLQKKGGIDNFTAAEYLYQQILQVSPNDVNTHLNLGLLYEEQDKKDQAIEQYQKTLDTLPQESVQARSQVQAFIDNVRKGISNKPAAVSEASQQ
jgi:tetratricopeptide (TPR) repeat protein